jgi:hypothetical protein
MKKDRKLDQVHSNARMDQYTMENSKTTWLMERVRLYIQQVRLIWVNGKPEKQREQALILMLMVLPTLVSSRTIKKMARGKKKTLMGQSIREVTKMVCDMEKVLSR